jgi:hypothetical protein
MLGCPWPIPLFDFDRGRGGQSHGQESHGQWGI